MQDRGIKSVKVLRTAFIECVEFSRVLLEKIYSLPGAEIVGIVTRRESKYNSDFCSLEGFANVNEIPCFVSGIAPTESLAPWLRVLQADFIFCFGWSQLLDVEVLSASKHGVIGYHPAPLPKGRGRHPIIWSLVLGLEETASTFFFIDEGADSGDIFGVLDIQRKLFPLSQ